MAANINEFIQPQYTLPFLALSDSSVNNRFKSCARKLELNKLYDHTRSEYEESQAAGAGHALHAAYQQYLATGSKEAAAFALMMRYPIETQRSPNEARSLEACYSTFLEMLANPIDSRYKLAYVQHQGKQKPAVEVPFRITFKDVSLFPDRFVPIYWDGYIDIILWDTLEQVYVVVDIKTTRKSRYDYSEMFKRDQQCLPYAYVLEKALGQAAESLRVIYFVCYIDAMEPRAVQYPFEKTKSDIQEWAFSAATDINAIRHFAQLGFFPKNGKSCDVYSVCQYADVCDYDNPNAIRGWLDLTYGKPDYEERRVEFQPWFELALTVEGLL